MLPSSRAVVALASVAAFFEAVSSCAPTLSLDDRRCPCTAGYRCCESIDTCRPNGVVCPDETGTGGSSASRDAGSDVPARTGGAGPTSAGGVTNTGGSGVSGSAGNADAQSDARPAPPHWRSLGAASLDAYEVRDGCDLEIDSKGVSYVAFRSCSGCPTAFSRPPVVLKYDGARWQPLPAQGLLPTTHRVALALGSDDVPHVLVENAVLSFDGAAWIERVPRVTGTIATERNFELDSAGRFLVTAYDAAKSELSVLRLEGNAWRVLGSGFASDAAGERLTLVGTTPWIAHTSGRGTAAPGAALFVRRFDGAAWPVVEELEPAPLELAVTSGEAIYVARQTFSPGAAIVTEGHGAVWTEILNTSTIGTPALRIGPDGALYATYLMDGFVNLSRWDGSKWIDADVEDLGTSSSVPVLRLIQRAGRIVPFLCLTHGADLAVMTYE